MKLWKRWEGFLIYVVVIVATLSLRLVTDYPDKVIFLVRSMIDLFMRISEFLGLIWIVAFVQTIPVKMILFLVEAVQMSIGFVLLLLLKRHMEQGAMILIENHGLVMKAGSTLYGMLLALLFVFTYSVIGIPVGAVLLLCGHIVVSIGKIPLAIFFGYLLMERLSIYGYTILYYFVGSFIMFFCESVYAVGGAFLFFVFPVLALGTFFTLILERIFYKMSYPIKFRTKASQEPFDRKKIRDIITEGL